jgi:predicted transcriptional regulator
MKAVSLKIEDEIFSETEEILRQMNKSRNKYLNEAINHYNQVQRRNLLAKQIKKESELVRGESMLVLNEFELIDDEN